MRTRADLTGSANCQANRLGLELSSMTHESMTRSPSSEVISTSIADPFREMRILSLPVCSQSAKVINAVSKVSVRENCASSTTTYCLGMERPRVLSLDCLSAKAATTSP